MSRNGVRGEAGCVGTEVGILSSYKEGRCIFYKVSVWSGRSVVAFACLCSHLWKLVSYGM